MDDALGSLGCRRVGSRWGLLHYSFGLDTDPKEVGHALRESWRRWHYGQLAHSTRHELRGRRHSCVRRGSGHLGEENVPEACTTSASLWLRVGPCLHLLGNRLTDLGSLHALSAANEGIFGMRCFDALILHYIAPKGRDGATFRLELLCLARPV